MPFVFTLQVPADPAFRALAGEVGGRFVEILGGTSAQAAEFVAAIDASTARLAEGGSEIDLTFSTGPGRVDAALASGPASDQVSQPLPVGKG